MVEMRSNFAEERAKCRGEAVTLQLASARRALSSARAKVREIPALSRSGARRPSPNRTRSLVTEMGKYVEEKGMCADSKECISPSMSLCIFLFRSIEKHPGLSRR